MTEQAAPRAAATLAPAEITRLAERHLCIARDGRDVYIEGWADFEAALASAAAAPPEPSAADSLPSPREVAAWDSIAVEILRELERLPAPGEHYPPVGSGQHRAAEPHGYESMRLAQGLATVARRGLITRQHESRVINQAGEGMPFR